MPSNFADQLQRAFRAWWREELREKGFARASTELARRFWGFLRDSTPERRRSRYGDMEYDWDHRVNTTSGTVGWRERLLGVFYTPYQPTDPAEFREIMAALSIDFREFTFIDLGSGKGRTLLMASEYPFKKIVGVEIVPELHRAAVENVRAHDSSTRRCSKIETICADAREFDLPEGPLMIYLFNPLSQSELERFLARLTETANRKPKQVIVIDRNSAGDEPLTRSRWKILTRINQTVIYLCEAMP